MLHQESSNLLNLDYGLQKNFSARTGLTVESAVTQRFGRAQLMENRQSARYIEDQCKSEKSQSPKQRRPKMSITYENIKRQIKEI